MRPMSRTFRVSAAALVGLTAAGLLTAPAGARPSARGHRAAATAAARAARQATSSSTAARMLGPASKNASLHLDVVLQPRDPAALAQFVTAVSTPSSPLYRHYLAKGQ